jgi:hypothetical protein
VLALDVNCLTVAVAGLLSALGLADPEGLARSAFAENDRRGV